MVRKTTFAADHWQQNCNRCVVVIEKPRYNCSPATNQRRGTTHRYTNTLVYIVSLHRLLFGAHIIYRPTPGQMKGEGVEPGAVVYTAALAECRWAGEQGHVEYLNREMDARGLQIVKGTQC